MSGSCCAKPVAKIIKVGEIETGIMGLEIALRNTYLLGPTDEEQAKEELLAMIRAFGNDVSPSREEAYKQALLREYRKFCQTLEEEAKAEARAEASTFKKKRLKLFWVELDLIGVGRQLLCDSGFPRLVHVNGGMFLQLAFQRRDRHAEQLGGLGFVAGAFAQRFFNQAQLELRHGLFQ